MAIISGAMKQPKKVAPYDPLEGPKPLEPGVLEAPEAPAAPQAALPNTVKAPEAKPGIIGSGAKPAPPGAISSDGLDAERNALAARRDGQGLAIQPRVPNPGAEMSADEQRARLMASVRSGAETAGSGQEGIYTTQAASGLAKSSYASEQQQIQEPDTPRNANGRYTPGSVAVIGGKRYKVDEQGIPRFEIQAPMNPSGGQWGEYQTPQGDKFTGVRNGQNFFRGVLFTAEGLNQGGGNNGYGVGFGNWLRHHIPILLSQLPPGDPERATLERALQEAGGPLTDGSPMAPGPVGRPPDTPTTPPPTGGPPSTTPPTGNPPPTGGPPSTTPPPGGPTSPIGTTPTTPAAPPPPGAPTTPIGTPITGGPSNGPGAPPGTPDTTAPAIGQTTIGNVATWQPATGIVNQIRGITPQTVRGTGYDAAKLPDQVKATSTGYTAEGYDPTQVGPAEGYTAEGYTAETGEAFTHDENLSQAAGRIIDKDSELMQRARAKALQEANARGLINSSMAVEAGQAAVLDKAVEIGAGDVQAGQFNVTQKNAILSQNLQAKNRAMEFTAASKNEAAKFLAAEKNQNGRFNAQQSNDAKRFTAEAKNRASEFAAAAANTANLFNAGEANKRAMFAVEQTNLASRFAAEMDNAASQFNATAFNQAQQRYTDAMNAAIAAQNDAENLARRDTASATNTRATEQARISAQRESDQARIAADLRRAGMELSARETQSIRDLGARMFSQFSAELNNLMRTEMEPDARQNAIHNMMRVWAGTPYLPFEINLDAFPPAGGAPNTGTPNDVTRPPVGPPNTGTPNTGTPGAGAPGTGTTNPYLKGAR